MRYLLPMKVPMVAGLSGSAFLSAFLALQDGGKNHAARADFSGRRQQACMAGFPSHWGGFPWPSLSAIPQKDGGKNQSSMHPFSALSAFPLTPLYPPKEGGRKSAFLYHSAFHM